MEQSVTRTQGRPGLGEGRVRTPRFIKVRFYMPHQDMVSLEEERLRLIKEGHDISLSRLISTAIRQHIQAGRRQAAGGAALAALLAFGLLVPGLAGAQSYGSQITQAGQALYSWIRSIGAVILAIGISGAGFQMAVAHDKEAMKKFFYVILGGLIVFLAPSFVGLIQGVAGSAQSLNMSGQ
jgi:hypothetical protein